MSRKILCLFALLLLLPIQHAFSDQEIPPFDYAEFTTDGRYILVMFIPDDEIDFRIKVFNDPAGGLPPANYTSRRDYLMREGFGTSRVLRVKYPCAGLYLNNGSDLPLWTIDWYSSWVYIFSDGEHLIRMGPWPKLEDNVLAMAFYRNGHEIKRYTVEDLVADLELLPSSISHYMWLKEASLDETSGLFRIKTLLDEEYVFDVPQMGADSTEKMTECKPNELYTFVQDSNRLITIFGITLNVALLGSVPLARVVRKHLLHRLRKPRKAP